MTMWGTGLSIVAGLGGSIYSANKAEDIAEKSAEQSADLPDWIKPYMLGGGGGVPDYIANDPLVNTNWMDYVQQMGDGNWDAPWQPMTDRSLQFHPERQFTPVDDGSQFGGLPPAPDAGAGLPPAPPPAPPPADPNGDITFWDLMGMNKDEWVMGPNGPYTINSDGY